MEDRDYLLPDGYEEEETTEPVETGEVEEAETLGETEETTEVEPSEETTETTETPSEPEFKLPYKYNHQEGELGFEDAQKYAQLGMLYANKIAPEMEQLKAIVEPYNEVKQLAELYGMGTKQLVETLKNQYIETQAAEQGVSPEYIRKEQALNKKEKDLEEKDKEAKKEQASKEMFSKFLTAYPNVDLKAIKPETWAAVDAGMDLTTAYTRQENEELRTQLAQKEKNQSNRVASPVVSATKTGGAEPPKKEDDFLSGLMG